MVPQALVLLVQPVAPLLLRHAPLVLLALYPYEPWSVLVAGRTAAAPFFAVVVLVRVVPCCGDFLAGRWYGDRALGRLSRRGPGRVVAAAARLSTRGGGALLVLYPGATASVLAGTNALPVRRFLPLTLAGITAEAVVSRALAAAAPGPLAAVAGFVDRYALAVGSGLLVTGLLGAALEQRRRRAGRARRPGRCG